MRAMITGPPDAFLKQRKFPLCSPLAFWDSNAEDRFQKESRAKATAHTRVLSIIAAAILLGFVWQDKIISPSQGYIASLLRIGVGVPLCVGVLGLSYWKTVQRYIQIIIGLYFIFFAAVMFAILLIFEGTPFGLSGSMGAGNFVILLLVCFTFSHLFFVQSLITGISLMILYAGAIYWFTYVDFLWFLTGDFLTAVAAFLLGSSTSYFREKTLREQFTFTRDLAAERDRYKELLAENQQLARELNESVNIAQRSVARLTRFFSPAIAETILEEEEDPVLGGHHRSYITVVFCDLRGWTDFTLKNDPEDVMRVLEEYHREMGAMIFLYNATIEQFTGDGLMVFFNDPIPISEPAQQAVRMAVAMRQRAFALIDNWRQGEHELGFGVGIDQGYASIGTIGFEGRYDYAAIGPAVNRAARLCAEAKHGQILISQRVLADAADDIEVEEIGNLDLRGIGLTSAFNVTTLRTIDGEANAAESDGDSPAAPS
jgi:class 3 adenylate cyclase